MIRYLILVSVVAVLGLNVLTSVTSLDGGDAALLLGILLVIGIAFRLTMEYILHVRKRENDRDAFTTVLGEPEVTTYLNIAEYNRVAEERHRRRMTH